MAGADAETTLRGFRDSLHTATLWGRRLAVGALAAVLIAAVAGALGLRTGNAEAEAGGYRLHVQYPAVARAGLDVVWSVAVHHPGGFGKEVTLRLTRGYTGLFEHQGYSPEPSAEHQDAAYDYLTFDAPAGDTFTFDVDAYVQPASHRGTTAEIAVLDGSGTPVVSVGFRTRLLP